MDIATLIGLVGGTAVILYGMLSGGDMSVFINVPSVVVTFMGGLTSVITSVALSDFLSLGKLISKALSNKSISAIQMIRSIVELSQKARREGLLALESSSDMLSDSFLKKSLELVVDGVEADVIRAAMELDIDNMAIRHKKGINIFKTLASQFPAWGMIGTLIGLVILLRSLDDPAKIGPSMAIALITTFYGSVLANFVCTPMANKLAMRSEDEIRMREMMIEGVLDIQAGINPRILEYKLKTFLSPAERLEYEKLLIPSIES
jgi:chemotaxis protein MotA